MSSSVDSSNNVVNIESSMTRTASGSAREGSELSRSSDGPSYDWVDPLMLRIPIRLRDSDSLGQFLANHSFLIVECPSDAVMANICCTNNVVNIKSSVTRTASNSARKGGELSRSSDNPSYDWVDPSVLRIPTRLRDSDSLDQFLANHSFLTAECPLDAIMVDICGTTDRVCHSRENAPQDFFFVYSIFLLIHM